MCTSCKAFFGSEAFKGLCSSCHKYFPVSFRKANTEKKQLDSDTLRKESLDTQPELVPKLQKMVEQKQQPVQKKEQLQQQPDRKRCYNCKKKVGLLGVECKCGFVYCNNHRLPEQHSCSFNHQKVANDRLKEALVKVYNGKISDI